MSENKTKESKLDEKEDETHTVKENPINVALNGAETFDFARVDFFDDIADLKITYCGTYHVMFYKFIILASDFEALKSCLLDKDVKEIESKFDDEALNLALNFMCKSLAGSHRYWVAHTLNNTERIKLIKVADYYGSKKAIQECLDAIASNIDQSTCITDFAPLFIKHKRVASLATSWLTYMKQVTIFDMEPDDAKKTPGEFWATCFVLGVDNFPVQVAAFVVPYMNDISGSNLDALVRNLLIIVARGRKMDLQVIFKGEGCTAPGALRASPPMTKSFGLFMVKLAGSLLNTFVK